MSKKTTRKGDGHGGTKATTPKAITPAHSRVVPPKTSVRRGNR